MRENFMKKELSQTVECVNGNEMLGTSWIKKGNSKKRWPRDHDEQSIFI